MKFNISQSIKKFCIAPPTILATESPKFFYPSLLCTCALGVF